MWHSEQETYDWIIEVGENLILYLTEIRLLAAKQYQIAAERANLVASTDRSNCNLHSFRL